MIIYKTKWKSYIADLYIPAGEMLNIVVLVPGLPKSSNPEKIVGAFLSAGSAVLYPNFSGMLDSGGQFDCAQCIKDVSEFIEWAHQPEVTELYFEKRIELNINKKVILAGMSFGAIVSLFASNEKVDKLLLLSPALLFDQDEIDQIIKFDFKSQMNSLMSFLKRAFPHTYRVESFDSLSKFLHGQSDDMKRKNIEHLLNGLRSKTLIIHGKMDSSVPWQISDELRKSTDNALIEWKFPKVAHRLSSYSKSALDMITDFVKE